MCKKEKCTHVLPPNPMLTFAIPSDPSARPFCSSKLGGQFVSIEGVREAVRRVKGVQLEIEVADAQQVRAMLKANYPPTDPMAFVHYAMCAAYVLPGAHEY